MTGSNNLLIGQIALDMKLVTPEQVREVLKEQPRLIGAALVAKGYITDEQLVTLIEEQRRRLDEPVDYAGVRKDDMLFGRLLVKRGHVGEEFLNLALRRQQELAESGLIKRLGEILVAVGAVTAETVRATLAMQNKTLMACPSCGTRFNVIGEPGPCEKCGVGLVPESGDVRADKTARWTDPPKGE
ncbi:MAG: hypothetical protein HYY17_14325 [Planctomycetes bacterium]|nr:hypothetical protein [Planctomycetota bacterium]